MDFKTLTIEKLINNDGFKELNPFNGVVGLSAHGQCSVLFVQSDFDRSFVSTFNGEETVQVSLSGDKLSLHSKSMNISGLNEKPLKQSFFSKFFRSFKSSSNYSTGTISGNNNHIINGRYGNHGVSVEAVVVIFSTGVLETVIAKDQSLISLTNIKQASLKVDALDQSAVRMEGSLTELIAALLKDQSSLKAHKLNPPPMRCAIHTHDQSSAKILVSQQGLLAAFDQSTITLYTANENIAVIKKEKDQASIKIKKN